MLPCIKPCHAFADNVRFQLADAVCDLCASLVVSMSSMADVAAPADREPGEDRRATHKKVDLPAIHASTQASILS